MQALSWLGIKILQLPVFLENVVRRPSLRFFWGKKTVEK